jgi:hypothetical protein
VYAILLYFASSGCKSIGRRSLSIIFSVIALTRPNFCWNVMSPEALLFHWIVSLSMAALNLSPG